MKVAKMLSPETDTEALAKRAFMHLHGVTDEWIKSLEVEKIAGGQVSPDEDIRLIAALIQKDTGDSCCEEKCSISRIRMRRILPTLTHRALGKM